MTTEFPKMRADIPSVAHPSWLTPEAKTLAQENTIGADAISTAHEALINMYSTMGSMVDAEKAHFKANPPPTTKHPVRTPRQLPRDLLEAAGTAFERTAAAVQMRVDKLEKTRTALAERVNAALSVPENSVSLANGQEVRTFLRSVSPTERQKTIREAIAEGDVATVSAALNSKPFLSGLKPDQIALLRDEAAAAFAPVDHAQLGALDKTLVKTKDAAAKFVGFYQGMTDRRSPTERAAADAKAALAGSKK